MLCCPTIKSLMRVPWSLFFFFSHSASSLESLGLPLRSAKALGIWQTASGARGESRKKPNFIDASDAFGAYIWHDYGPRRYQFNGTIDEKLLYCTDGWIIKSASATRIDHVLCNIVNRMVSICFRLNITYITAAIKPDIYIAAAEACRSSSTRHGDRHACLSR